MDLIDAVCRGDTDEVKQLLRDGRYDVNFQFVCGWTLLHLAVMTSNADMVKLFLDSGADVNAEDWYGWTPSPLYEAANKGHEDIVKLLLEHGADPNITSEWGRTPLHEAALCAHEDIVKLLLEHGADPNITNEWVITPLHKAVDKGHEDIVKLLLEHGADPNITNKWGTNALYGAAVKGHDNILKLLLEHGADPNITNKNGWAPLHVAAYKGHEDIVKLLLEHGADPNITNKGGRSPLHEAALYGHEDSVKLLLEHGADPHITSVHKETAYDKAEKKGHEHVKIVLHRYALPPIQAHLLREMIMAISDHVSLKDVRMLARAQLGIPDAKLDNIEYEFQRNAQGQSFQILWLWKERTAGATVHDLFKALKDHQLNACLDKVRDKYVSLLNGMWAMPEDEFQKFHSSLQPTKSSKIGVTSPRGKLMYLKCFVSEDLESLEVPLESFIDSANKDGTDSAGAVLKYGLIWKGICGDADTSPEMAE